MSDKVENWKDIFKRQLGSGKYWNELFKEDFDGQKFLDRSDAVYICKKAQADTYKSIIDKIKGDVDDDIIEKLEKDLEDLWNTDDSALGIIKQ